MKFTLALSFISYSSIHLINTFYSSIYLFINICNMKFTLASSSISGNAMKWKCRKSRGVTGFLPPPGGPMAPIKFTSSISLKLPISFLSYHPEKIVIIYLSHILNLFILRVRILHFSYTRQSRKSD